ncbi:Ionotropic receptor 169 [Frankliniella occidentalis]|nr:Ionotropic receptor 169 [Frankliniella occidentalis]
MQVFLVLTCLCCVVVVPGVRADLPVVDSAVTPVEARSAAALLTPFMQPQKATLVVLGRARWTGAFLRELSADVPRVLRPSVIALKRNLIHDMRLENHLIDMRSVHLVHTGGLQDLLATMRVYDNRRPRRVIFWATLATPRDEVLQNVSRSGLWAGGHQSLALTAPDGTTTLYNLTCSSDHTCMSRTMVISRTDEWSTVEQRWRRGGAVFMPFCGSWHMRGNSNSLNMRLLTVKGYTASRTAVELAKSVIRLVGGRDFQQRVGSNVTVRYEEIFEYRILDSVLKTCNLDAVIGDIPFDLWDDTVEKRKVPDMRMNHFAAIVPAGCGASTGILDAVTVEFSAMLWCATALATLSTVVVLMCTGPQDVSGAVLQALAPMLGQPPPPPAPPRPMLAAWLLACVVLTAAYQGLLLGKLSSAVPRRDLESLQELKDSGLPLKVIATLEHSNVLDDLDAQAEYVAFTEVKGVIDTIATARNCALITLMNRHIDSHMLPFMMPPKKLHVILLPFSGVKIVGVATQGSPLLRPLSRVLALAEAAGLLEHWRSKQYEWEHRDHARKLASLQGPRPLTLFQLGPAFTVLGVGQAAGVAAFVLEALCTWWPVSRPSRSLRRRTES